MKKKDQAEETLTEEELRETDLEGQKEEDLAKTLKEEVLTAEDLEIQMEEDQTDLKEIDLEELNQDMGEGIKPLPISSVN